MNTTRKPTEEAQTLSECIVLARKLVELVWRKHEAGDYSVDAVTSVKDALSSLSRCRDFLKGDDGSLEMKTVKSKAGTQ